MKRIVLIACILFWGSAAYAYLCERMISSDFGKDTQELYELCALQENNDTVQSFLGRVYLEGEYGVVPNMQKALLFYHLSAENGNAKSQMALAKLLLKMDEKEETREKIKDYLEKMDLFMKNTSNTSFDGSLLHPYALLMLASENKDQKWYYVSEELSAPEAGGLLRGYQLDKVKKKQMQRMASEWKQRKMLETAKEVYNDVEYQKFENSVQPRSGVADAFVRSQAIEKLKQDVKKYKGK
ncbi:MAG: sel1 repeat family protein [Alphaproteobacteria bacterium]|nr:sel1 repeat family protein [Alphaproteobacteria bacterium]